MGDEIESTFYILTETGEKVKIGTGTAVGIGDFEVKQEGETFKILPTNMSIKFEFQCKYAEKFKKYSVYLKKVLRKYRKAKNK